MTDLEKAILKTITYFDVFNYPLTDWEIQKWLYKYPGTTKLSEIRNVLANSQILKKELILSEGFYSLRGRENIYLQRKQNNNLAERKYNRALRLVRLYRFVPYIKMVAVCNSLSYSNAADDSDIDFFIITKKNKIWIARFLAIILVGLSGFRPRVGHTRDAYCLSFFIDESKLDIRDLSLGKHDIYFTYWLRQLMPIYNPAGLYEKFLAANSWTNSFLPNAYANKFVREVTSGQTSRRWRKFIGVLLSPPFISRGLDAVYRQLQMRILGRNLKAIINIDTRVVVNDRVLKLHNNDRREYFYKKWKELIRPLLDKYEEPSAQII
ncbi:MAG: hypothetical protein C3F02_01405 [Parcubacteria group bacterium]|nr:MAG: hypothetical protein C3F02_01405 [Parcubacteria group bacterium]